MVGLVFSMMGSHMKRLPVLLLSFSLLFFLSSPGAAAEEPAKLANTLRWTTASEVDNFGFDIYRGDQKDGPFVRLTQSPIPGAGTSDVPTQYEYHDETIEPDREYFYYVESIAMDGRREHFTPVVRVAPKRRPE